MDLFKTIPEIETKTSGTVSNCKAENRALAIREQVNHLRSLGDCFITRTAKCKETTKRANPENSVDKWTYEAKKRFGRSIKNRCPGYLQAKAKQLFESTGGTYVEVPILLSCKSVRSHQILTFKEKLSQRMYHLTSGTKVQRDWYSSYLLYCINKTYTQINKLNVDLILPYIKRKEHD